MTLEKVADTSQATRIHNAIFNMARYGEATSRIRLVARMPLTFQAIMHEVYVYQKDHPSITDQDVLEFQRALQFFSRHLPETSSLIDAVVKANSEINSAQIRYVPETTYGVTPGQMAYGKPNGGNRILPSIYNTLRKWWMRANGVIQEPMEMNDGHLENTMALLRESHGNVISKSTLMLGKMANHFRNQPAIVAQLESLCIEMQGVDVDDMYPIFNQLAKEFATRERSKSMVVVMPDPSWFDDGELDWSNK